MTQDKQPSATEIESLLRNLPDEEYGSGGDGVVPPRAAGRDQHRRGRSAFSFLGDSARRRGGGPRGLSECGGGFLGGSVSVFVDSVSGGIEAIAEDVRTAAAEVGDAFKGELKDARGGDKYFLDMAMTRNMSVAPEDLTGFLEEATGIDPTGDEAKATEASPQHAAAVGTATIGSYLGLFGAVMAVSSNGTAQSLLTCVAPPMKLYWRMTATAAVLFVFAARTVHRDGPPKMNAGQWMNFGAAVLCFTTTCLLFFTALGYTSVGNTVIYANSQAVILLIGKFLAGERVLWMEGTGAVVAFAGAILCSVDSEGSSRESEMSEGRAVFGDFLALCSAVTGVGYLTFAKAVRPYVSVTVFMFLVMFSGSVLVLAYMLLTELPVTFSNDPCHGLFGWMNARPDRFLLELWIALVCNVLGTMGFVFAMQYFDNLVISVATLMEPMVASFIAYQFHVSLLPGPLGWTGNAMVALGTLAVVYPSVKKGGDVH